MDAEVFISYSTRDRERVQPIVEALLAAGVSVFWDQHIIPGQAWETSLTREIEAAKAVVVFWSAHSVKSDYVAHEAGFAAARKKLVPLKIDRATELPLQFRMLNYLDFRLLLEALVALGVTLKARPLATEDGPTSVAAPAAPSNRGYAFISHVEEDVPIVSKISGFLKTRSYAYWTYHESDRDYQKPTVLELAFAREIKKPLFHLRFRSPGPTLAIAGDTYFDFERGEHDAFRRLGLELDKKGL